MDALDRLANGVKKKASPPQRPATAPRGARTSPEPSGAPAAPLSSHRVALTSGGTVVLSLSVDLFGLTGDDRDFVFDLIDRIRAYADRAPRENSNTASA